MDRRTILYRGSLKSCNYHCGYCPFSKHRCSERELEKDRTHWFRFCESLNERAEALNIRALMVVPYGEALIHPWYWEGLGALTKLDAIDAAGSQTNLSFSIVRSLEIFEHAGGVREKLRLWATFHPEMTSCGEFAEKCAALRREGILFCAGAVGVPENLEVLQRLREMLPREVYLWINAMDGLGRSYTEDEFQRFSSIDPYFYREIRPVPADESLCRSRLFVEADGTVKSSVDKFYTQEVLQQMKEAFGAKPGDLILILSGDDVMKTRKQLCELRLEMGAQLGLRDKNKFVCLWVIDFPMFEWREEEGRPMAMHNPFTHPKEEDIPMLDTDPAAVRADAYDMVINGVEVGGGSIRIHDAKLQAKMFEILGFTPEKAEAQFGFLMNAFKYGAPPHGGLAYGLDRWVSLFAGLDSIRDCIAFPKNNSGRDVMLDAPSVIDQSQLDELNLIVDLKEGE